MIKNLFRVLLFMSAALSMGCVWGEDAVQAQGLPTWPNKQSGPPSSAREQTEKFRADVLPQLHLEGDTARNAIDKLGRLGFMCTLVGEEKNLFDPSKPLLPFVNCRRLLSGNDQTYGLVWVHVLIMGWKGDGTPLAVRYDQLVDSKVAAVSAVGIAYEDNRDSPASKEAARHLDQTLVLATPGQPMAEVVKYAMLHDISCRTTTFEADHRTALDCSVIKPSAQCSHGLISIDVTEGKDSSPPLSLWSTDRQVKGRQGPWICPTTR
ncbi:MAG: hypothetical protein V4443_06400 [Pseudomonadota bacterium]